MRMRKYTWGKKSLGRIVRKKLMTPREFWAYIARIL